MRVGPGGEGGRKAKRVERSRSLGPETFEGRKRERTTLSQTRGGSAPNTTLDVSHTAERGRS